MIGGVYCNCIVPKSYGQTDVFAKNGRSQPKLPTKIKVSIAMIMYACLSKNTRVELMPIPKTTALILNAIFWLPRPAPGNSFILIE